MSSETHILKLPRRTVRLELREEPTRIVVRLTFDRVGDFGDLSQFEAWMLPILEKYDSDPRPTVMEHPTSGETATIFGDEKHTFAFIRRPKGGSSPSSP